MLTTQGGVVRLCDGISRRSFLRIGSLGVGGLSLPGFLSAGEGCPADKAGVATEHAQFSASRGPTAGPVQSLHQTRTV